MDFHGIRRILLLPAALIALNALTPSARAEGTAVDFTFSGGVFNPTENNLDEVVPGVGSVTARHGAGNALGARLDIWLNDHFALEGTGTFMTGSSLEGQAFGIPGSVDASFFYGSARGVLGIGQRARLLLSGGVGLANSSYDTHGIEDGSLTVGVLGIGALIPLGNAVSLRLDVDNYIYNMYWELDGLQSEERLQRDVVAMAGLTFHTGR